MDTKLLKSKDMGMAPLIGGTQGARRATGVPPAATWVEGQNPSLSNPEVCEKRPRRKFTAKYKLDILEKADKCTQLGQTGVLLRKEGLYSSNPSTLEKAKGKRAFRSHVFQETGSEGKREKPLAQKVAELERENERLKQKLKKAETIIDAQKNISDILGISQEPTEDERRNS